MLSTHKKPIVWIAVPCVLIGLIIIYVAAMLLLPLPKPTVKLDIQSGQIDTGTAQPIAWPASGNAAISAVGYGVLDSRQTDEATPTASTAKIILALATLRQKPLQLDETGPTVTLTSQDVGFYENEIARNGSSVPVIAGEQLNEYQLLQALLLPSGNNIATTIANWAFGSEQQYVDYANQMLSAAGLSKTNIADASGYSPETVSTPSELAQIGQLALAEPVLAQIVSQQQATLPIAGVIKNTNELLAQGYGGIKTGHTDQSGGCLIFSTTQQIDDQDITLVGAMQLLPDMSLAFPAAIDITKSSLANFTTVTVVNAGQTVGTMSVPWASPVDIIAKDAITQTIWKGTSVQREVSAHAGLSGTVGSIQAGQITTDLVLKSSINNPDAIWRLTHPIEILQAQFAK